jgi:hypothetical protein
MPIRYRVDSETMTVRIRGLMFGVHAGMNEDELQVFWSECEAVAWVDRGSPVAA